MRDESASSDFSRTEADASSAFDAAQAAHLPFVPRQQLITVAARGEHFPIMRLQGQLFVCSKANGNCCCGWIEKGRAPVNVALYEAEWESRRLRSRLHLSFTGCLGVCTLGNNALLLILSRSIWLKDLNDDALIPPIFDYAEAMLQAGRVLPPSAALRGHVYERFLPPPTGDYMPLVEQTSAPEAEGFEFIDPVCFMKVNPATAKHWVEFRERRVYFCAPSCKKLFVADPAAYLPA